MKMAKSYKLIFLLTAFVLSIACALCMLCTKTSFAEEGVLPDLTEYFELTDADVSFNQDKDKAVFSVTDGSVIKVKNQLVIDNLEFMLGATNVEKIELSVKYDSFYVNGNKNAENGFDKEILNTFEIIAGVNNVNVSDYGVVSVNGISKSDVYYKARKVDKTVANEFYLTITLAQGETEGTVELEYINQKAGNDEYKQAFALNANDELEIVNPVVAIDAPFFVRNAVQNGDKAEIVYNKIAYNNVQYYSLSYKAYSVLGDFDVDTLYPVAVSNTNVSYNASKENYDRVHFQNPGLAEFKICGENQKEYETYQFTVIAGVDAESSENQAPKYVEDELAREAFLYQFEKTYKTDSDAGFVPLESTIEIPSLEDLVVDDRTSYEALNKIVYYVSASGETSNSELNISLNDLGDYYFYVVFGDQDGKYMSSKEDFVITNDDGVVTGFGQYGSSQEDNDKFVFYFSIDQQAEISITPAKTQGVGYKGTKFTASKFDIKAIRSNTEFKLYFNPSLRADANDEGWVEIKRYQDVDKEYSDSNGYTYEILKSIEYDGKYTFTPNKAGSYKITCKVTSELSHSTKEASTVIRVSGDPKTVTPANHWLRDNAWSVVFLSIGSVCLVAVVVLLFVKPKES